MHFIKLKRREENIKNLKEKSKKFRLKFRDKELKNYLKEYPLNLNRYLTNYYTGGIIKKYPEDFIVEEVTPEKIILEVGKNIEFKDVENWKGNFIHFTLEKKNWTTLDAIREIAKKVGVKRKHFGFAGNKDKVAITTQRVGCFNVPLDKLKNVRIKNIVLRDFQKVNKKIKLGDLWGNRFTIRVREPKILGEELKNILEDAKNNYTHYINYYGIQRFGEKRPITHIVGRLILERNWELAFYLYCGTPLSYDDEKTKLARKLVDEEEFKEALKIYPRVFLYERRMIQAYLESGDYKKAFKILPPYLRCMFVNAYQSYLFNEIINKRYEYGFNKLEGDIVYKYPTGAVFGYKVKFASGIQGEIEKEIWESENLEREKFKIEDFGSFQGDRREMIQKIYNFDYILYNNSYVVKFCLRKGCYATTVLREFLNER